MHVYCNNEKMKVFLAAQTLSNSTSAARTLLETHLKDVNFAHASATATFCKQFNDMFDLLNSRSKFCKTPGRRGITKEMLPEIEKKVNESVQYIEKLEINVKVKEKKKKTKKSPAQNIDLVNNTSSNGSMAANFNNISSNSSVAGNVNMSSNSSMTENVNNISNSTMTKNFNISSNGCMAANVNNISWNISVAGNVNISSNRSLTEDVSNISNMSLTENVNISSNSSMAENVRNISLSTSMTENVNISLNISIAENVSNIPSNTSMTENINISSNNTSSTSSAAKKGANKVKKPRAKDPTTKTVQKSVLETNSVSTGFLGFIISLKNLYNLAKYLIENNVVQYFLSYKSSQDHLEMFFSLIRRMNGNNNNPTTTQFKSAYKKLICNKLSVAVSPYANCTPLDETLLGSDESVVQDSGTESDLNVEQNVNHKASTHVKNDVAKVKRIRAPRKTKRAPIINVSEHLGETYVDDVEWEDFDMSITPFERCDNNGSESSRIILRIS